MADVLVYWDNAVVERFFGSLKYNWLFKVFQPTLEHMKQDMTAYMRYDTGKGFMLAMVICHLKFEGSQINASSSGWPEHVECFYKLVVIFVALCIGFK